MDIRQAIQHISIDMQVDKRDRSMALNLMSRQTWDSMCMGHARKIAKKYKMEVYEEFPGRRAVLRDEKIYCFGTLYGSALSKFKAIPGLVEWKENKFVPVNHYSIKILRELGFNLSSNLKEWEEENRVKESDNKEFDERLYPFQVEGIKKIEELKGRVLLSDEVGLGKSAQVCVYIKRNPEIKKVILICPSGLRLNWKRECKLWGVDLPIKIIQGMKDTFPEKGIVILSYNVAFNFFCQAEGFKADILIADESSALIHSGSQRTKAVRYLSQGIKKTIFISATPLTSRPKNLYDQLNILNPDMFNSRQKFLDTFCGGKKNARADGCTNPGQLHEILSNSMMIRRKRKDVMDQLPEKTYTVVPIELNKSFRDEYEFAKKETIEYIKQNYGNTAANRARFGETMVRMEHLKQISMKGKAEDSLRYIENIVESGEPVVVFATHKFVIEMLVEYFGKACLKIDGSLSVKQKQANVDLFQTDESIMVMACNVQAGGTGITLTRANHIVLLQYDWTPAIGIIQPIGRIDRIGQKSMSLQIHYLVASETIEEYICETLHKKAQVIGNILDNGDVDEGLLLNDLIEQFKNS